MAFTPAIESKGPGLQDVAVIALAAARLARAISTDDITAGLRERLDSRADECTEGTIEARLCRTLVDLVNCPLCTGWWASLAMSLAWPGRYRLRRGVAVAGAQVLLTFVERLVSEQGRASIHEADVAEANVATVAS